MLVNIKSLLLKSMQMRAVWQLSCALRGQPLSDSMTFIQAEWPRTKPCCSPRKKWHFRVIVNLTDRLWIVLV